MSDLVGNPEDRFYHNEAQNRTICPAILSLNDLFYQYKLHFVYCRELGPGTVSLTGDRVRDDDSKHYAVYTSVICILEVYVDFDL